MIHSPNTDPSSYAVELQHAIEANPFESVLDKYHALGFPLNDDQLTELAVELEVSEPLKAIKEALSTYPEYSALYRYDPFTLSYSSTWGGETSNGPKVAWLRMFKDLQFDNIKVIRGEAEVAVIIDQPSVLVASGHPAKEVQEPTVLFSSNILKGSAIDVGEIDVLGMTFTHGHSVASVLPKPHLRNHNIVLSYYHYESKQRKK
jgi:hypothetical protein